VHHEAGLRKLLADENTPQEAQDSLLAALKGDYTRAAISSADHAMLDYALKLTIAPASITADDIARLRVEGFTDRAIHDICAITAYFAFVNRIADGLGVELDEYVITVTDQ